MFADPLFILRGEDIKITDSITIHQPVVDEIIDFGEHKFFTTFTTLSAIPSDMKSALWDAKIDWNDMSDFDLFLRLAKSFPKESTELILPGISFPDMDLCASGLVSKDKSIIIDKNVYTVMIEYIREFLGIKVKKERAANRITKMALIDEDRRKKEKSANKPFESFIFPMTVTLVNTEEFPYDYKSVMKMTLFQMTKSYQQIQKKKHANALMQGSMSGFIDASKIKSKDMNWCYE